jgi:2-polyprenyl-3-methyl-5-hydroxy-6-metoxy-1,4-benzoquinol methylase
MDQHSASADPIVTGPIESSPRYASLDEPLRSAIRANLPADDWTIEQLASSYNFRSTSDRRVVFTRLLIRECIRLRRPGVPLRVVDIGSGRGIGRRPDCTRALSHWIDEFWSVEPDAGVTLPDGVFTESRHAMLEEADLPENAFDMAYSFMVMEHVSDPARFFAAVARCLRPGGVYIFMTPNANHYFSIATRALKTMGLEELVLRFIAGEHGRGYHYPVQYRCNSRRQIERHARDRGLGRVDIAYLEEDGPRGYMKGPLRPVFHLLAWKRTVLRRPDRLLTFLVRMTRDEG